MAFVQIGTRNVNVDEILTFEVEERLYMNGSAAFFCATLRSGERIWLEHGYGFDAYDTEQRIKAAVK